MEGRREKQKGTMAAKQKYSGLRYYHRSKAEDIIIISKDNLMVQPNSTEAGTAKKERDFKCQ